MSECTNNPERSRGSTLDRSSLRVIDLGRISYAAALERQYETHARVLAGEDPPTAFLLEHDPVITRTRRAADGPHLVAGAAALVADGIELADTDRGGDITYHGPGQLVVYPIVPLNDLRLNVRCYVHKLEQTVIDTLAAFGLSAERDDAGVGVWVDGAKVAAIGVRVRRWVTLHGFALNVTTDLGHFRHIVPCGLTRPITSLERLLGRDCPDMQAVKDAVSISLPENLF